MGMVKPVSPSLIISGTAQASVPIQGKPKNIASKNAMPKGSNRVGKQKTSADA
jgi:hypothetical protein